MTGVLVTGFAGYLGRVLVPFLQKAGHHVYGFDNFHLGQINDDNYPCRYRFGDVRDMRVLQNVMREENIDAVVHLAAIVGDAYCDADPALTIDVNNNGTAAVAEAAERVGVRHMISASTCSVYGDRGGVHPHPITLYAWSKAAAEKSINRRNIPIKTVLRFGTLYGWSPQMRYDLVGNIMTKNAVEKGNVKVFGGDQRRPLAHVLDISRVIEHVLRNEIPGTHDVAAFNISILDLGEEVADLFGARLVVHPLDSDMRDYDALLMEKEFGLKPQPLATGLLEISSHLEE